LNPKLLQLGVFQVGIDDLHPPPNTVVKQTAATARRRVRRELTNRSVGLRIRAFLDGFSGSLIHTMDVNLDVNSAVLITLLCRNLAEVLTAKKPHCLKLANL